MKAKRSKMSIKACFLFVGLFFIGSCPNILYAAGSEYPNRAVTLIVPFAAGGTTDLNARIFAEAMEKHLKQPVVVVNKPGGSMTIAGYAVASAKPDGYTLGFLVGASVVPEVFAYFYSADYSSNDLRPICRVCTLILTILVRGDAPWNSHRDIRLRLSSCNDSLTSSHKRRRFEIVIDKEDIRICSGYEGVSGRLFC